MPSLSETPRDREPAARRRLVRRAVVLSDDPAFHERLATARTAWNKRWPCYRISGAGLPPADQVRAEGWPAPAALVEDLAWCDEWDEREWQELGMPARTPHIAERIAAHKPPREHIVSVPASLLTDPRVAGNPRTPRPVPTTAAPRADADWATGVDWSSAIVQAVTMWKKLIRDLCEIGWPPADFPHAAGWPGHPGAVFVGLCLMYDPRLVPEDTIRSPLPEPVRFPFDPLTGEDPPHVAAQAAKAAVLERGLEGLLQSPGPLEPAHLAGLLALARQAAQEAEAEARARHREAAPRGRWVLPLTPELSWDDWRDIGPQTLRTTARNHDDDLRLRVWELQDTGENLTAIGRRLGLSRDSVARLLKRR